MLSQTGKNASYDAVTDAVGAVVIGLFAAVYAGHEIRHSHW
jgi:hypothetical protein